MNYDRAQFGTFQSYLIAGAIAAILVLIGGYDVSKETLDAQRAFIIFSSICGLPLVGLLMHAWHEAGRKRFLLENEEENFVFTDENNWFIDTLESFQVENQPPHGTVVYADFGERRAS